MLQKISAIASTRFRERQVLCRQSHAGILCRPALSLMRSQQYPGTACKGFEMQRTPGMINVCHNVILILNALSAVSVPRLYGQLYSSPRFIEWLAATA